MEMVIPRWRSSGALSIWSSAEAWFRSGNASCSLAAAVPAVAEHRRKGHEPRRDTGTGALLDGPALARARLVGADVLAHVVLGGADLHDHHRLEQLGARLAGGLLEGLRAGA